MLIDILPLIFSVLATFGALALLVMRIRLNGLHHPTRQRYVFIDLLLLVACAEIMLDAIADSGGYLVAPEAPFLRFAATVGRGMVAAGVAALLISFPDYVRWLKRTPGRRRDDP